jgi:hypothetical protein
LSARAWAPWAGALAIALASAWAQVAILEAGANAAAFGLVRLIACAFYAALGAVLWASRRLALRKALIFVGANAILVFALGFLLQAIAGGLGRLHVAPELVVAFLRFAGAMIVLTANLGIAAALGAFDRRRPLIGLALASLLVLAWPLAGALAPQWLGLPPNPLQAQLLPLIENNMLRAALILLLYPPLAERRVSQAGNEAP